MKMVSSWLTAAVLFVVPACTWAQAPVDACELMGRDEFAALTGKPEYSDPTSMPLGEATVCGYANGQVLLFTGEGSMAGLDRLLASFGQEDLPRTPVEGLGDGAFALFYDPENPYQDHGAFVVFGAGPPTVAVTVYAEEGEKAESVLPQAMAAARAIAAKLQ
jgi:hypothetical protein